MYSYILSTFAVRKVMGKSKHGSFRLVYGVSHSDVEEFISRNSFVANWLKKYAPAPRGQWLSGSRLNKARLLCRFFRWLRIEKGIDIAPKELLNRQLQLRQSKNVEDRQWLLNLALEHSRDNLDFESFSDGRKYDVFNTIKNFCGYYEVPLTIAKGVFGKHRKKKNYRKQVSLAQTKKILGGMNQRGRTICLIQLQSGMEIGAVLNKFSYMWHSQIKPQLDQDCERLKIEFDERKANGACYFTYVSRDGIHELKKWLAQRKTIRDKLLAKGKKVRREVIEGEPIFITSRGTPLRERVFLPYFTKKMGGKVTTHMFRKLFKTEASIPDRGIDRNVIEFFLGHTNGIDAVGAEYDRTPEIYEEVLEKEYAKLEPYINIYSGSIGRLETESRNKEADELKNRLKTLEKEIIEQKRLLKHLIKASDLSIENMLKVGEYAMKLREKEQRQIDIELQEQDQEEHARIMRKLEKEWEEEDRRKQKQNKP